MNDQVAHPLNGQIVQPPRDEGPGYPKLIRHHYTARVVSAHM
jgi:hypothetical protein